MHRCLRKSVTIMKWSKRRKPSEVELTHRPSSRSEALDYRPEKNRDVLEEELETGEILLTYPLILKPWFLSLARKMGLRSREPLTRKLQLDAIGSLTWTLLDGKRSVQDLINLVCRRYNLNKREAEIAMTGFLREMGRRGLIGLRAPHVQEPEEST
jgi:hypothetical protein